MPSGCGENHANRDQKQHHRTTDLQSPFGQMHDLQKAFAHEHEHQQNSKRNNGLRTMMRRRLRIE